MFTPAELNQVDLLAFRRALRADLDRAGGRHASGWLVASLHGEFQQPDQLWHLHWHIIATGGMIEVVDRLRTLPKYRGARSKTAKRSISTKPRADKPVVIKGPVTPADMAWRISYQIKRFWLSKFFVTLPNGKRRRSGKSQQIVEPFHAQYLLWLDMWQVQDLILLYHLHERDGQLAPNTDS